MQTDHQSEQGERDRDRQPYQDGFCRFAPQRCPDQWKVLHATPRALFLLSIVVVRRHSTVPYPRGSRLALHSPTGEPGGNNLTSHRNYFRGSLLNVRIGRAFWPTSLPLFQGSR